MRLYQLYTSPGEVTDVTLEAGEQLVSVSAGDTVRWGDRRHHVRQGLGRARAHPGQARRGRTLKTNVVINTDRRTYHLELTSTLNTWMASASWDYPQDRLLALQNQNSRAEASAPIADGVAIEKLRFRYAITRR